MTDITLLSYFLPFFLLEREALILSQLTPCWQYPRLCGITPVGNTMNYHGNARTKELLALPIGKTSHWFLP